MLANSKNEIKRQAKKEYRRTEGKLELLNEKELIRQVCMHPIIYDRSLKGYRKMSLRKQCWNDICKAMDSTEEECRKRWKSLRDSFAKLYKAAQRLSDTGSNKQCKWVYYEQMSFLIPHLDGVSYDFDKIFDEFGDISDDAQSRNSDPIMINAASEEQESNEHYVENMKEIKEDRAEHNESLQHLSTASPQATDFAPIPIPIHQSPTMHINDNNNGTTSTAFTRHHHTCRNHNTSTNTVLCRETNGDNGFIFDSDEKFLLSCAPTLRRLTHRENALARLKIQQILFDIEFDQKDV